MSTTITTHTYGELSDNAKERALNTLREINLGQTWYKYCFDTHTETAKAYGFSSTDIYFSGFCSQGDGAMFEYTIDGHNNILRDKYIESLPLSPMRKDWLKNNIYVCGIGVQRGLYYHANCCSHNIYWDIDNGDLHWSRDLYKWLQLQGERFEDFVLEEYADLCAKLYRELEKEHDQLTSDEAVESTIIANEYQFTEDGEQI